MKKFYIIIIVVSILFIGIGIYFLTSINFNNEEINSISGDYVLNNSKDSIRYGEFLKLIISESSHDIDFDLIETSTDEYDSYLKIAENYGIIEKGEVSNEMLYMPISRIDAIKLVALCDINIRGNELNCTSTLELIDIDNLTEFEKSLLRHVISSGLMKGNSNNSFKPYNNLTNEEASEIVGLYKIEVDVL